MRLFLLSACLLIAPALSAAGSAFLQKTATRMGTFSGIPLAQLQNLYAEAVTKDSPNIGIDADSILGSAGQQQVLGVAPSILPSAAEDAPAIISPAVASPFGTAQKPKMILSQSSAMVTKTSEVSALAAEQVPVEAESALAEAQHQGIMLLDATPAQAGASDVQARAELISEQSLTSLQKAAASVSEALQLEEKEEQRARELDRKAAEAHGNSAALIKQTMQDAMDAGVKEAHAKADQLMEKISNLEDQAERAEVRAAALKAKSKMEFEEGQDLMVAAKKAVTDDSV